MDRDNALELLRHNHDFPCPYDFRIVLKPQAMASVVAVVSALVGGGSSVLEVTSRESRTGKYVSVRMKIFVPTAETVLDVYALLREQTDVITVL